MYAIRKIDIKKTLVNQRWEALLVANNIRKETNIRVTYGIFNEDDLLIATGSIYQNILKCIAVSDDYRGGSILGQLITCLIDDVWQNGYHTCYVYTKAETVDSFKYSGFKEIARVNDELVFLEKANKGFDFYCEQLREYRQVGEKISAIVMNANPFSKGHQYLVEQAAEKSDWVYVFVLSEDVSEFPFSVRKQLVEQGVKHLSNVMVLETSNYMISSSTFPSYFLKEDADVIRIQAQLDATIFAKRIAKELGITHRFVGEEPFSITTAIYNEVLEELLKPEIIVEVIKRKEVNDEVISATTIRMLLKENKVEAVKDYVPPTTYEFLISELGMQIINNLRKGGE